LACSCAGSATSFIMKGKKEVKNNDFDRFLRLPQVLELIPIGRSTLWAKVKKGEFPKPEKLSAKIAVWRESDIQAYINGNHNSSANEEVCNG